MNILIAITMLFNVAEPNFDIAKSYGIDSNFAKAVAIIESGANHSSFMARVDKNLFGMIGKKFEIQNDSIHYFCRLIKSKYKTNDIDLISTKYCPPNSKSWAAKVKEITRKLEK